MELNLLINFFLSAEKTRNDEYLFCLQENVKNKYIKKIFVFLEDEKHIPDIDSENRTHSY